MVLFFLRVTELQSLWHGIVVTPFTACLPPLWCSGHFVNDH